MDTVVQRLRTHFIVKPSHYDPNPHHTILPTLPNKTMSKAKIICLIRQLQDCYLLPTIRRLPRHLPFPYEMIKST